MSLQKGFFMTEPFNPNPFWDNTIVNLSGAQKFEEDTVFPAGRYSVDVQAGGNYSGLFAQGYPGVNITEEVRILEPFVVRAYCGSGGNPDSAGTNPYVGEFKVNPYLSAGAIPSVNHIFGNAGSPQILEKDNSVIYQGGGNCLGDGRRVFQLNWYESGGAGSCLHIMPVGGTFGTDYLFAFHIVGTPNNNAGGGGSAYGGAGSAYGYRTTVQGSHWYYSSSAGGNTPYGTGGAGVRTTGTQNGNSGTGVGFGGGGRLGINPAGAWFDGTQWLDSRELGTGGTNGHIIVKYLGSLN